MARKLSKQLREYLLRCGLPENKIARCSSATRMWHDLGLYGDIAEAYIEVLIDHYHVDMNGFEFDRYFPPEFAGSNVVASILFSIIPFAGRVARQRGEYSPLTLNMIESAIQTKQWSLAV